MFAGEATKKSGPPARSNLWGTGTRTPPILIPTPENVKHFITLFSIFSFSIKADYSTPHPA